MRPEIRTDHKRTTRVTYGYADIKKVVLEHLLNDIKMQGLNPTSPDTKIEYRWGNETEGSPAYDTGFKLTIEIVEDLAPPAREESV